MNLNSKASGILLQDFHSTGGNRLHSWRAQTNPVCARTQEKGAATPGQQNTGPDLPVSI